MTDIPFIFIANLPALDFINTEPVIRGQRVDLLTGFEDLVRWVEAAGFPLGNLARRASPTERESIFRQAIGLRKTLRDAAERLAGGKGAGGRTVEAVNRILASRPVYRRLVREGKRYTGRLDPVSETPSHLLVPIAESAAWLLEHGDPALVRNCENPECVLFFYDTTKNRTRRWCSMDACGSRAKALAYYRRKTEKS